MDSELNSWNQGLGFQSVLASLTNCCDINADIAAEHSFFLVLESPQVLHLIPCRTKHSAAELKLLKY